MAGRWLVARMVGLLSAVLACAALAAAPLPAQLAPPEQGGRAGDGQPAPKQTANVEMEARRLLVSLRAAWRQPARQVEVAEQLVGLGPAGIEALRGYLDRELERLGRPLANPPPTAALDEKIEQLRKVLADLRADPQLSKEKLQQAGLPALDQLSVLWRQREVLLQAHYGRLAGLRTQIERWIEVLKRWQADGSPAARENFPMADYQQRFEALLARATPPQDERTRQVLQKNAQLASQLDPRAVAGMQALNAMRIMCGLAALEYDPKLCAAAAGHSKDMDALNFFSHESPVEGKKSFTDRARLAGTTASGENIYMGSGSPADALKAWFLSPGHHKNMFNAANTRQGLGRVGRHWTQMFGR